MKKKITVPPMGWLRDYPDFRDFTVNSEKISPVLKSAGINESEDRDIPVSVDLTQWCSPVEHQDDLGSCSAHAGVGLLEYYERRAFGKHIDASRLFLYKATRNLLKSTGDSGATLRTTMAAMVLFGVPPEEYYPYEIEFFDEEPPAFCYAFAQNYQAIKYFRLDPSGIPATHLLAQVKWMLANGLPSMFGFTVYNSISEANSNGKIPFPGGTESDLGGHAVMAVGYDDRIVVRNMMSDIETEGAILIRNSWGEEWGDGGYGWLPYRYVLEGLAVDWWSLIKNEWTDTMHFGL